MSDSAAGTRTCWNCGDEVPAAAEVCETCGAPRSEGGDKAGAASAGAARLDIGDVFADRYEIRGITAEGALGDVYKVQDREIGVSLALKVIHPRLIKDEARRKALRGAIKKARRFLHKNVVKLYESGEADDRVYFTMEFLGGVSLRKLIQVRADAHQHFTLEESAPIIEQLAGVLDEAHKQGLRHGSLKPDNIVILPTGLKLSELGVAGFLPGKELIEVQHKQDAHKYLAPEHAAGGEITPRADLYALGAILYEMLTGAPPEGPDAPPASEANEAVPAPVDELLTRCLEADPQKRPESAGEIYGAIAAAMSGAPAEEAAPEKTEPEPEAKAETVPEKPEPAEPKPEAEPKEEPPVAAAPIEEAPVVEEPAPEKPAEETVEEAEEVQEAEPVEEGGQAAADAWDDIKPAGAEAAPTEEESREPVAAHKVSFPDETTLDEKPKAKKPAPKKTEKKAPPPPARPSAPAPSPPPQKPAAASPQPSPQQAAASQPAPAAVQSKSSVGLILGVLAIVAVIGGGAFFALSGGKEKAEPAREVARVEPEKKTPEPKPEPREEAPKVTPPPAEPPAAKPPVEEKPRVDPEAKRKAEEEARRRAEEERRKAEEARQRAEEERKKREAAALAAKSKCPGGMIEIAGGSFNMGSKPNDSARDTWEKAFEATNVGGFCIDQYEFPGKQGEVPRVSVTWEQARALCSGRGKRLCTEEEWEKACKGKASTRYPYGDRYQADACNTKDAGGNSRQLSPAGSFAECKSDYGVFDMSGSAKEWTDSYWSDVVKDRVVRGGSYSRPDWATRCAFRENFQESHADDQTGFRCCKDY